jgi:hypothetical protein
MDNNLKNRFKNVTFAVPLIRCKERRFRNESEALFSFNAGVGSA